MSLRTSPGSSVDPTALSPLIYWMEYFTSSFSRSDTAVSTHLLASYQQIPAVCIFPTFSVVRLCLEWCSSLGWLNMNNRFSVVLRPLVSIFYVCYRGHACFAVFFYFKTLFLQPFFLACLHPYLILFCNSRYLCPFTLLSISDLIHYLFFFFLLEMFYAGLVYFFLLFCHKSSRFCCRCIRFCSARHIYVLRHFRSLLHFSILWGQFFVG